MSVSDSISMDAYLADDQSYHLLQITIANATENISRAIAKLKYTANSLGSEESLESELVLPIAKVFNGSCGTWS